MDADISFNRKNGCSWVWQYASRRSQSERNILACGRFYSKVVSRGMFNKGLKEAGISFRGIEISNCPMIFILIITQNHVHLSERQA
jgi:hypothetical protein